MLKKYRETHLLADWVGLTLIWDVPRLVGRYCSYLLPKQAGGTPQIKVNPTQVRQQMSHPVKICQKPDRSGQLSVTIMPHLWWC